MCVNFLSLSQLLILGVYNSIVVCGRCCPSSFQLDYSAGIVLFSKEEGKWARGKTTDCHHTNREANKEVERHIIRIHTPTN